MKLQGKVAIVTGAASGIGKDDRAERYAREGAKVAIADLNLDAAERHRSRNQGGRRRQAMGVAMDVTDEAAVERGRRGRRRRVRRRRRPGQQRRHPDRPSARRVQLRRVEEDDGDPSSTAPSSPRAPACRTCTRPARRQHHLHGFGALQGSVGAEGAVRHRQARADRPRQGGRQGRRRARRARQRDLSGFVRTPLVEKQIPEQAKALGHLRGGRHQEGDAEGHGRRRVHDRSTTSPKWRCCSPRFRPTRSPANRWW